MKSYYVKKRRSLSIIVISLVLILQTLIPIINLSAAIVQQQDFKIYKDTGGFQIVSVVLQNPNQSGERTIHGNAYTIGSNTNGYRELVKDDPAGWGVQPFDQVFYTFGQVINNPSKGSYLFTFNPAPTDKIVLKFLEAGELYGEKVDIEVTYSNFISDGSGKAPAFEVAKQLYNGYTFAGIREFSQEWKIYKANTPTLVNVGSNSYVTFNSLNHLEYIKPMNGLDSNALLADNTNVQYTTTVITANDAYKGINNNFTDKLGSSSFTRNSVQFNITNSVFKTIAGTDKSWSEAWNAPSSGTINMPAPIPPTKNVTDTDEKKVIRNALSSISESFTYELIQQTHSLGNQLLTYYNGFSFTDQIDSVLNIDSNNVKVEYARTTNPNSRVDITDQFDIVYTNNAENKPNNISIVAKNTILENDNFYGSLIYVTIPVKIDLSYFALHIDAYRSGILNNAVLTINSHDMATNSVTTIPFIKEKEIHKDVDGQASKTLTNKTDTFTWEVDAVFGVDVIKWQSVVIRDEINSLLDINKVTVVDQNGNDVSANGTLSNVNNVVEFTLNKKNGTYTYLADQTYTLKIESKIKATATTAQLAPFIKDGGIPNEATLAVGDGSKILLSEKPVVIPPTEQPVIHKDVDGEASKTLTNKTDTFTWEIDASFGSDAYKWDTVIIKDTVNALLDINKVTVVDQDGKDVKANGTLTTTNNVVEFTLTKQNNSYEYLAGQTYTLKIESKIKATATTAQLAPFIKDGGIPNEATLAVGDGSKILLSEKPVVIPPTEQPVIHKDVDGEASKTLTNKADVFTWEIDASFGSDAYKWDTVIIKDTVNTLLDINKVTVVDQDGKDVKANGTLTTTGNVVEFTLNKQNNSFEYLAGQTYTLKIESKIKATATTAQLAPFIKDGGIPNEATLAVGDGSKILLSEKPVVIPPTEQPVIHKDVDGEASKTLTNKTDTFTWEIDASFGSDAYKWDTVIIKDTVNALLDINKVTVVDQDGKDVKANGTLTTTGNIVEFTLAKQNNSFEYLTGQTYTLKIESKIKATATTAQLAPFIKDGGIPNEATLAVGDGSKILLSEKPVVIPPSEEPVIHKDVDGEASKTLTNKADVFTWEIDASFGSDAYKWDTVIIKDEVNALLDISKVTVVDQDGKDVKANGTLTTTGNVVEFTLAKQNNSFEYLAGQTYTLKIESKIKATATTAQLAPFIKDGGIPNEATLAVGDGSKILLSEKPVVIPPTEQPVIHKDVDGQASKTLTNKTDTFTWEIDASFGSDAYKWDTVIIKDTVNAILDINKVTVVDQDGKDVSGNGTLTTTNNVVEFTLTKQNNSFEYLAGQTYTLKIESKIKATATTAQLAPFIKDGGIPNEATLAVGDGSKILLSEKPVVIPPTEEPVIHKDVDGEASKTLTNKADVFTWEIDASFGSDAYKWDTVIIKDEVNALLDINKVTVVDQDGKDVKSNGTLTTTGNIVEFTLNKQNNSFEYLAGQTYTLKIESVIASTTSTAQLAPFIKDGGIPNEAVLVFGDGNQIIKSEIPTVVPPTEEPVIHKDVDGLASKTLTNKADTFTWEVEASFGSDAYKWDTVIIKDTVNAILDINKVTVVDQDGTSVLDNGTLSIVDNVVEFTLNEKSGSFEYLAGQTYTLKIESKIKTTSTTVQLAPFIKDGGIPNQATLAIGDGSRVLLSEIPVVVPPTEQPIIKKTIDGLASKTLTNKADTFTWEVEASFGSDAYKWDTVIIKDTVNAILDINKVTVVDQDGKDVLANGTLTTTGNVVEYTLTKQNNSFEYLAGQTYTLKIESKIKETATTAELAPYIKDGGIPNQATLAVGDGSKILLSEKPVVIPPTEVPIIHKDVDGQSSKTLTNKTDIFTWEIAASFGSDAYKWDTVIIKDEVNTLLDINKVTVVDQDGEDVLANGTLTTTGNVVEFTLSKQNNSFEYLAGQTYTLKIESKIKATATTAELAPYIKDGGIPNQATLAVGDGSEVLLSEKPVVVPPTEVPIIHKDVDGVNSKILTNISEKFTWDIEVEFGSDSYKWEKVVIKDEVISLMNIDRVTVIDQDGNDVLANGTLKTVNNVVVFTLNEKNGSFEYLAGQTYTLKIESKIKATATTAELAPYIKDGGIPNQATLTIGDGSEVLLSEKPVVVPPTEQPVIKKTIDGKASKTLTNKADTFTWEVEASFGSDAYEWDTVIIKDVVNTLLDINKVTVVDQDGKDVSANGTLSTVNNVVEFILNKQNNSFEYLAGQTYTLKIESKIKATATAAELEHFTKNGGIPNQATLSIGDGSEILLSEKPVVVPPTEVPINPLPDTGVSSNIFGYSGLLLLLGSTVLVAEKKKTLNKRK